MKASPWQVLTTFDPFTYLKIKQHSTLSRYIVLGFQEALLR